MTTTIEPQIESPAHREFATANEVIDFDNLQIEIVPDEHSDAPWESGDCYEHEVLSLGDFPTRDDARACSGYFNRGRRDGAGVIRLVFPRGQKGYGTAKYMSERGASKQAAFEAEMENQRCTRERLAAWRGDGWECYGVRVSHEGEEIDSCWGFYDDDAEDYGKQSVTQNALAILEKRGFIVRGVPAWVNESHAKGGRRQMPGNVHYFDHGYNGGPTHSLGHDGRRPLPLP